MKVEEQLPNLIIFVDIDEMRDSPAETKKKCDAITRSMLPAGAGANGPGFAAWNVFSILLATPPTSST